MVRYIFPILMVMAGIAGAPQALERSAALPYDYANSVNKVFVPSCTANQYVAVSGTIFVCKDFPTIPTCTEKQTLSQNNGTWTCKDMPSAVPAGSFCGLFTKSGAYGDTFFSINRECEGMVKGTYSRKRFSTTILASCPQGYTLTDISGDMVSYRVNNASDSDDEATRYEPLTYSCLKN